MDPESFSSATYPRGEDHLEMPVSYSSCDCSKERFQRYLVVLGAEELADLISEGEEVETVPLLRRALPFPLGELQALLDELSTAKGGT